MRMAVPALRALQIHTGEQQCELKKKIKAAYKQEKIIYFSFYINISSISCALYLQFLMGSYHPLLVLKHHDIRIRGASFF